MDSGALTVLTLLALLVRGGHAAHTIGSVRARSVADAAIRATLGSAVVVLVTWLLGRTLALAGASEVTGRVEGVGALFTSPTSLIGVFAVALVPSAIVEGASAERMRVLGGAAVGAIVVVFAWMLGVAIGWSILRRLDASHSAISSVWPLVAAHAVGGVAGLVAAKTIGPRTAKYNRDGSANILPPHDLTAILAGDAMLLVGLPMLAGVIAGDVAARAADALLAAAAASVVATIVSIRRERRVDAIGIAAAAVCGSVIGSLSTPGEQMIALALGAISGAVLPIAVIKLDLRGRVDDPTSLTLIHLIGGGLGTIGASAAAERASWAEAPGALAAAIGLFALAGAIAAVVTLAAMRLARRVPAEAEVEGVDLALHDVNAYPDFQQTMIKSYHLRE